MDVAAIDAVARRVLVPDPGVGLFLIDEIGKMECLARGFVDAVRGLLARSCPLLATVALRGEGLIEEVKRDPRARLVQLTRENRDRVPEELTRMLRQGAA